MNITFDKSELRSDYKVLDLSKNAKSDELTQGLLQDNDFDEFETFDSFSEAVITNFENCLTSPEDCSTKRLLITDFLQVIV
jgi:hypothetical protein